MARIEAQLAAALVARGFKEVQSTSRKYRAFQRDNAEGKLYFVGKSGALRIGRNATDSTSLERTQLRTALLNEGRNILGGKS
jgi:hypothetical protein